MTRHIGPWHGRKASLFWLALTRMALGPAAAAQKIERSRTVYHIEVCPGPAAPGTARCHAHVVTDSSGKPFLDIDRHGHPFIPSAAPARGGGKPPAPPAG